MGQTVVVTGATGFLGRAVCRHLVSRGHATRALVRSPATIAGVEQHHFSSLSDESALHRAFAGADMVIHLAARVHQMRDDAPDPFAEFRRVNTEGTRLLASVAAQEGVRQVLFASSVKAVGEGNERPWTELDSPVPVDPYGISKLEAERALAEITAARGLATTVLRLPLVYGPGVKANMYRLFELVHRGVPLPFGGIDNARSLVYVENAAAAFAGLLDKARGHEVFFASDGEDVSTPELIRHIARALDRPARLVPGVGAVVGLLARLSIPRLSPSARRLAGSLTVDSTKLRERIGPMPFALDDGLTATAAWFLAHRSAA